MKKTIPIEALRVGMFLAEPAYDGKGDLLLAEHVTLTSPNQIRRLRSAGVKLVLIDPEKGEDWVGEDGSVMIMTEASAEPAASFGAEELRPRAAARPKPRTILIPPGDRLKPVSFSEEIARADQLKQQATEIARTVYEDARVGRAVETEEARAVVSEMIDSVLRNRFAFLSLVKLKEYDEYTFNHCVNVTTLTLVVARQMGFNREQLESIGTRAFVHDIGKMKIPLSVLNKPGKLNEAEWVEMKLHTKYGAEILINSGFDKEDAVVAEQHHERHDGSGYHMALKGNAIHHHAAIASLADVYDALTTRRVYKSALIPHLAMALMFKQKGIAFADHVFMDFVKAIGVYPIGSLVRLSSGEVGVVVSVHEQELTKPMVSIIFSRRGIMKRQPTTIDLTEHRPLSIAEALDPRDCRINMEDFISSASA